MFRDSAGALLPSFNVAQILDLLKLRSSLDERALPRSTSANVASAEDIR